MRFGWLGKLGTPLLAWQLKPRLGIGLDDLQPAEQAKTISVPKLFIAGTADRDTLIGESKAMFATAAEPQECWWIEGAAHEDMHAFSRSEYEQRVLAFLTPKLH